uniref:Uncharacterized protein n=1 Tax=Romanomermis culicivorax TaxID=13658 RepID=A0A915IFP0_ROMCU
MLKILNRSIAYSCTFDYHCCHNEACSDGKCGPRSDESERHLKFITCLYSYHCPSEYVCTMWVLSDGGLHRKFHCHHYIGLKLHTISPKRSLTPNQDNISTKFFLKTEFIGVAAYSISCYSNNEFGCT